MKGAIPRRGGPGKPVEGTFGGGPQAAKAGPLGRTQAGGGRGKHLVHARVDKEEARVAAGPDGGRGQAAVAVALLKEAEEGGADLPRRRAAGSPAAGAAAPEPRHRQQQQPPPQPASCRHGGRGRKAAPRFPEGAGRRP